MHGMDNETTTEYESPTLEVVGTVQEITSTGTLANADALNQLNTANPFVPPPRS